MAANNSENVNIDSIKVRVLGEKKARYDLDKLPKLKYKRKDKTRHERRSRAIGASCSKEVNEPDNVGTRSGQSANQSTLDIVCENTSAAVTDKLEVVTSNVQMDDPQHLDTSQAVVAQIGHEDTYVVEVCRSNALVPVNAKLTAFVIQDYDMFLRQLKNKTFLLIWRSLHRFIDGNVNWVYQCSCNPNRGKLINSMNISIKDYYKNLLVDNPACLHCLVAERILDSLERFGGNLPFAFNPEENDPSSLDHDYYEHHQSYEVFELPAAEVVCVYAEQDYGFVGIDHKGFKCSTCNFNSHACCHIKFLEDKIDEDDVDLPNFVYEMYNLAKKRRKVEWKPCCMSKLSIQFHPPLHIQQILGSSFYQSLPQKDGNLLLIPASTGVCGSCGSNWSLQNPVEESWEDKRLLLYTMNQVYPCITFYVRCSNGDCDNKLMLDGEDMGVINMKTFLVAHEVLRDYMYQFLYASCSLYAYFEVWTSRMQDVDPTLFEYPSYNQLRYAWYSYLRLLDIDYSDGSCCPECGSTPETVVCDATTVSFRRRMVLQDNIVNPTAENIVQGSYRSRIMIPTKACRTLLHQFISGTQFSTAQMESLHEMLHSSCPSIIPFLDWLTCSYDDVGDCPRSVKVLTKALAACSSVCGFVHPSDSLHTLLTEIVGGLVISQHPAKLKLLQEECPLLFNAFSDIEESTFPRRWYPLLADLVKKSSEPFSTSTDTTSPPSSFSEQQFDHLEGIAFFPNLPVVRSRGVYAADNCRRREDICTKNHPSHSLFLPGLFTIFCPHGINYGFEVMQTRESPNVPFTIFRTRFQNAPKIIIYDNACNLHTYCLNRDPSFFKDTKFLVDRFHWKNHRGCSEGYNIASYPQYAMLNSEVNEQANATLKRLRNQLSYMTQDNFVNHCKFHFWFRNHKAIQRLAS